MNNLRDSVKIESSHKVADTVKGQPAAAVIPALDSKKFLHYRFNHHQKNFVQLATPPMKLTTESKFEFLYAESELFSKVHKGICKTSQHLVS